MLLDQRVEILLSSSNGYDVRSIGDHFLGHGEPNARGCSNDEDGVIFEGHLAVADKECARGKLTE